MVRKKKREPLRQQRIPGTIDVPTEEVLKKGEHYVEMLRTRMSTQEVENVLRSELIELMRGHKIEQFQLDGYEVKLTHSETDKITIKKLEEEEEESLEA